MRLRQLQDQYGPLVADVPVPDPFSLEDFRRALAARRGRPIHLSPLPADVDAHWDAPCGLWLPTSRADHIWYSTLVGLSRPNTRSSTSSRTCCVGTCPARCPPSWSPASPRTCPRRPAS